MPVSTNYAAYVPVVSGRVTISMASGKLFDFVGFVADDPFWNAQIEQINVRDDLKIELVPRVGDAIIMLGTLDNYASKLEKLKKLYARGFNVIGWNRYRMIDLQYKDQIVCDKMGEQPAHKVESEPSYSLVVYPRSFLGRSGWRNLGRIYVMTEFYWLHH